MSTKTELTYTSEQDAQAVWEMLQAEGRGVSLLSYDPEREVYAFDYWETDPAETAQALSESVTRAANKAFAGVRFDRNSTRALHEALNAAKDRAETIPGWEGVAIEAGLSLSALDALDKATTTAQPKDPARRLKATGRGFTFAAHAIEQVGRLTDALNEMTEVEN